MTQPEAQPPPDHLTPESCALWRSIVADYELESHDLERLAVALSARDRAEEARRIIARDGVIVYDAHGRPVKHPATIVEKDATATFLRALRELDLAGEPSPQYRRPSVRVVR